MLKISVKKAGSIDRALKSLKKKVKMVKQNEMLRERKEYKKPSAKKRDQKTKAIFRQKINTQKQNR